MAVVPATTVQHSRGDEMEQVYNLWQGQSSFACGGRCMMGERSYEAVFTWIAITGTVFLYAIVAAPTCWREVHPVLPLCTFAVLAVTLALLLATSCSDPGVIPRRELILSLGTENEISALLGYNVLGGVAAEDGGQLRSSDAGQAMVSSELRRRGYKWCYTCEIVRPPRSSHCPDCDQCVLRYDHHCPFVMNCIGQRNYHTFVGFVVCLGCLSALVIPMLFWFGLGMSGQRDDEEDGGGTSDSSGSSGDEDDSRNDFDLGDSIFGWVVVGIASVVGVLALLVLTFIGYHFFLILTGQTTKEHWRSAAAGSSASKFQHDAEPTLCAPRGPPLFDPRAWVNKREWARHRIRIPDRNGGRPALHSPDDDRPPRAADLGARLPQSTQGAGLDRSSGAPAPAVVGWGMP